MTLLDALSGGRHKLTNLKSGPAAKSGQVLQHNRGKADSGRSSVQRIYEFAPYKGTHLLVSELFGFAERR